MSESHEHRVKRLYMRSIQRGIKEMDLILSAYASAKLDQMDDAKLTLYDALLSENDHDLYQWITQQVDTPAPYGDLIGDIQAHIASAEA